MKIIGKSPHFIGKSPHSWLKIIIHVKPYIILYITLGKQSITKVYILCGVLYMLIAAVRQGEQWPLFPCLRTHRSGNTCPSRTQTQGTGYHTGEYQQQKSGLCFNVKTVFLGTGIPIIKLRQSYDSYFILGLSYTGYRDLTIFSYWEIIYRYWDSHFFCPYLYFVNSYICWDLRYVNLCKFLTKWALVVQQSMIEVCWGLKFCIRYRTS